MPTDAKCGLVVGVGVVLAAGILYFRPDPPPAAAPAQVQTRSPAPAAAVSPPQPPARPADRGNPG